MLQQFLFALLLFFFGASLASFFDLLVYRASLGKPMSLTERSRCDRCQHLLAAMDLIPLLSYLQLAGRCRYCRHVLSKRYFLIELCGALVILFIGIAFLAV